MHYFIRSLHLFYSQPLNVVLGLFSDELHSLQDVGDVIDASLLDLQDLGGPVQIKNSIGRLGNQTHEFLGQQAKGSVVARPLTWRLWSCGMTGDRWSSWQHLRPTGNRTVNITLWHRIFKELFHSLLGLVNLAAMLHLPLGVRNSGM